MNKFINSYPWSVGSIGWVDLKSNFFLGDLSQGMAIQRAEISIIYY